MKHAEAQNDPKYIPMEKRFPRTIPQELFDAWQILRRTNDAKEMKKKLKVSRPIIDRALNYGHVKSTVLKNGINKFFQDRLNGEKKEASGLIELAKEVSAIPTK